MTIEENIAARKAVEELLGLVDPAAPQRFWEVLRDEATKRLPQPKPKLEDTPMNDIEAAKFERCNTMPYGAYHSTFISDVPTEYLARVLDPSEFSTKLRRYVLSDRFKKRQEQ